MDSKTSWDSLRKQARKLEAQLDEQMHLFRKLVYTKVDNDKENDLGSGIEQLLKELDQEFNRLRSSLRAKRDHASLLEDFQEFERSRSQLEDDGGSQEQSLLEERGTLMRSTGKIDGVRAEAQETLGTLVFQRSTFGGINSKISNINNRLPTVNNILSVIRKKKSMDTVVLSMVASVCTFFILIYWLAK
ncbi:Golgi SNAP receptor complex member 1-1-like isoform X4 [Cynara cardunculus var. scolymus]|uniref:Golgi SNAP receptor complex member 1-1-like isoform X4 n=1 Tax=Cynara cardunculus var. scolymus TaxID=59895 RepID=UPI000D6289BD|nr:Golgi SNAP receptor complex member 1-1-like isoform X4 [Cynara cardunculus var. scolymus]